MSDLPNPRCPICAAADVLIFFERRQVPVHCNVLWATPEAAVAAPRGELRLGFCAKCGLIYNFAFAQSLMQYTADYENSLHFSPRFEDYARTLAARLIEKYGLRGKDIIEIGCGQGDFLRLLCDMGDNRGIGFDPSLAPERHEDRGRVKFIRDFYSARHAGYQADLICCRHTLEHVADPKAWLLQIRRVIGGRKSCVVFFEVPNALFTLRDLAIWDLIYEHPSYFNAGTLQGLFQACGFETFSIREEFGAQFLCWEGRTAEDFSEMRVAFPTESLEGIAQDIEDFPAKYRRKVEQWESELQNLRQNGRRVVIWGAGSKGVTFLNTIAHPEQIYGVIDLNPRKHGKFIAGTGHAILSPASVAEILPGTVIVMNPIYRDEIRQRLAEMNVQAELLYF